jgi:glycosyltransferase involved in cell wall biosynthesis
MFFYVLFIFCAAFGIIKHKKSAYKQANTQVTLIVCVRNEQDNLDSFFESLSTINYPELKVIFVDDFSEDNTFEIINKKIKDLPFEACVIKNTIPGKKQALTEGVKQSCGNLIVTTDIDCIIKTNNIYGLSGNLAKGYDLVCGPVLIKPDGSLFSRMQFYDQLALSASSAGMGNAGLPFMCSAANMGFNKNIFTVTEPYKNNLHLNTGDDLFLLEAAIRNNIKLCWLYDEDSIIYTKPQHTPDNFIKQRMRWAQKASLYQNKTAIFVSLLILFINSLLAFCLLILPFYTCLGYITAKYLFLKSVIDNLFLFLAAYKLRVTFNPLYAICAFFFHLIYVPIVAIASLVINTTWKGRKVEMVKHEQKN